MQAGRKILNLRHDRNISQQDLAHLCGVSPSALSKIEAGINSPRANIIARIASRLGVTMEYLLDEELPYPYKGFNYRQGLLEDSADPDASVRLDVTLEERAYLEALRASPRFVRQLAYALPEVSMETLRLAHFLLENTRVDNPTPVFLEQFEHLLTTGAFLPREVDFPADAGPARTPTKATRKGGAGKKAGARKKAGASKKAGARKKQKKNARR